MYPGGRQRVSNIWAKLGLKHSVHKLREDDGWTPEDDTTLEDLFHEGYSDKAIGRKLSVLRSESAVQQRRTKKLGLTTRQLKYGNFHDIAHEARSRVNAEALAA